MDRISHSWPSPGSPGFPGSPPGGQGPDTYFISQFTTGCSVSAFVHKSQRSKSRTVNMFLPQEFNVVSDNLFSEKYSLGEMETLGNLAHL